MLKNSKIGYTWILQIIIGYYNRIFLISIVLLFFLLLLLLLLLFFDLETTKGWFFREFTCIYGIQPDINWALLVYEYAIHWQFITIHQHWNSTIFLNFKASLVIALRPPHLHPPPPIIKRHYGAMRMKIDMWLTLKSI